MLWGNAYAQIIRNGKGEVLALYPLMPDRMNADRHENGNIVYDYMVSQEDAPINKGSTVKLQPSEVLHIPGLGFDGLVGYSPIAMAKNAIGLAIATEEYGSKFFANGATPSGILEFPGTVKEPERVRESWNKGFGGENKHKVAILEDQCAPSYVRKVKITVSELIMLLDSAKVHELNGISADLISRYVNSLVGIAPVTIAWRISILRQYFKYAYLNGYVKYPIEYYLPHAPQRTHIKLPTVWSEEQIESLVNGIDTTNPVGKRDYAMMLIGARLGLRIGDIINLKFNDIDWDKKEISIVQRKTKEPLNLPLPNDVGWAIIDYLKNGRPITDCENIFVVHNAPYKGKPFFILHF